MEKVQSCHLVILIYFSDYK